MNRTYQQTNWDKLNEKYKAEYSSREVAYQYIRQKIINLEYAPGMPLSDKILAGELEMSRTPIREALILLATRNMVVVKPQSGTFVAPIDTYWIEIEQFKRFSLEKEVVTRAISKITDEIRLYYEEILTACDDELENGVSPSREQNLLRMDNAFHSVAFTAAGKEDSFYELLEDVQHIERFRMLSLKQKYTSPLSEHRQISNAIMEGRLTEALYLLEKHLFAYKDEMDHMKADFPEYFTIG